MEAQYCYSYKVMAPDKSLHVVHEALGVWLPDTHG